MNTIDVMKKALEAFSVLSMNDYSGYECSKHETDMIDEAIADLEQAIKQEEQQPVPVKTYSGGKAWPVQTLPEGHRFTPFNHENPWVGLSEEEILTLAYPIRWQEVDDFEADKAVNFAQMIEAKLKEKNSKG